MQSPQRVFGKDRTKYLIVNQTLQFQNRTLYFLVFSGALFLVGTALGPGLFGHISIPYVSWQFDVFHLLCHQDPSRSFFLNGSQLAVCARCIGIYSFFLIGWTLIPLIAKLMNIKSRYYFRFLIGTIILNLIDVLGNLFQVWTNTNESRLFLGALFGLSSALILSNEFFKKLNTED